jgi:hypothetical protein
MQIACRQSTGEAIALLTGAASDAEDGRKLNGAYPRENLMTMSRDLAGI